MLNRRPVARFLLLVLVTLLFAPTALSQDAGTKEEPRESGVTEKVHVRLIELSVTATNRKGEPILDLRPEDLVVKSRRRTMRINHVERVYEEEGPERELPQVRLHLDLPGAMEAISVTRDRKPHYFIFMIDVENDDKLMRPKAMRDISNFIVKEMAEEDLAAVISFNGKLNTEIGFTSERGALTEAIAHAYAQAARPNLTKRRRIEQLIDNLDDCVAQVKDAVKTADTACVREIARVYSEELTPASTNFLESLDGLVRYAGGLQSRATVFAVSHGIAVNPTIELYQAVRAVFGDTDEVARMQLDLTHGEGARPVMDKLIQLALREGVTFYFIDRSSAPAGAAGARQQGFYKPGVDPIVAAYKQPEGDMGEVAVATGGAFIKNKNAGLALRDAMNRERGRYTVGFYVDELLNSRDLKKIRVKAKRRGVRLAAGRGTYPTARVQDSGIGRITFGKTSVLQEEKKGRFVPFTIVTNPRLFVYDKVENAMVAQLTLHFVIQTMEGVELTDAYHFLSHGYPLRVWETGQEEQLELKGWFEAPDGDYRLIAEIRNPKSSQGGRIVSEVKIVSGK